MDKKKIVLTVLAVVSFLIWVRAVTVFLKGKKGVRIGETIATVSAQAPRHSRKTVYQDWKRDPFSLERMLNAQGVGLELVGIMYDEKTCHALINEDVVRIGDTIEGNKVIDIQKDKVILNDGQKNFELRLQE